MEKQAIKLTDETLDNLWLFDTDFEKANEFYIFKREHRLRRCTFESLELLFVEYVM